MHLLVPDLSSGVGQPPDQVGEVGPHLHQWHGRPVAPANPSGSSSGEHCCKPGSGGPIPRLARRPRLRVTPVPGAHASTVNSSIEARVRAAAGSWGGATVGPTIADATADVVADGARLMCSCTRRPCSARHIPVVRPMTPAPTTTTSYGASASSAVTAADPGRSACLVIWSSTQSPRRCSNFGDGVAEEEGRHARFPPEPMPGRRTLDSQRAASPCSEKDQPRTDPKNVRARSMSGTHSDEYATSPSCARRHPTACETAAHQQKGSSGDRTGRRSRRSCRTGCRLPRTQRQAMLAAA